MNKLKKIFLLIIALVAIILPSTTAYAISGPLWDSNTVPTSRQKDRLLDNADLLTNEEEADIIAKLDAASQKYSSNIVIVTVDDYRDYGSYGDNPQGFADDYFDYNGFGSDYNGSGLLFMLSMEDRSWAFSTSGTAIDVFTDYGQDELIDTMLPYLSDGRYYDAFDHFISATDRYYSAYANGNAIDVNNDPKTAKEILGYIPLSLIIGLILALIPVLAMKSQLDTVHMKPNAAGYQSHQGLNMRIHEDRFIRSHVSHTPRPQNNGSSYGGSRGGYHGGSSVHHSSSGHSHGGSHGHF